MNIEKCRVASWVLGASQRLITNAGVPLKSNDKEDGALAKWLIAQARLQVHATHTLAGQLFVAGAMEPYTYEENRSDHQTIQIGGG